MIGRLLALFAIMVVGLWLLWKLRKLFGDKDKEGLPRELNAIESEDLETMEKMLTDVPVQSDDDDPADVDDGDDYDVVAWPENRPD